MAENISTCKALGGGDFTSLAAWLAWAEVSGALGETAECYDDGGTLGDMSAVVGWAAGTHINTTDVPRVIAAVGHEHGGSIVDGAKFGTITNVLSYFELINMSGTRYSCINTLLYYVKNNKIKGNIIGYPSHPSMSNALQIKCNSWGSPTGYGLNIAHEIDNNIFVYADDDITHPYVVRFYSYSSGNNYSYMQHQNFRNNLVIGNAHTVSSVIQYKYVTGGWRSFILQGTGTFENNMMFGGSGATYDELEVLGSGGSSRAGYEIDITPENCLTDDASADDSGGSNHQINKSIASCIEDWQNNNFNLVEDGPGHNTGLTNAVTTDMFGVSRPDGIAFDMGPLELVVPTDVSTDFVSPTELLEGFDAAPCIMPVELAVLIQLNKTIPVELLSTLLTAESLPVELIELDRVFHDDGVWILVARGLTWTKPTQGTTWTLQE